MNRSKLGFFQDLGTRACVMSMLKRAAMCGAITLTFSCPLPLCLGTRFVAHLIKVGVIVLKTDEKAGFLFWRCGLRPGRAAHCHQACEKAEDQQAVHWRVCAPEGLNHLCQKLFLSIDEHVGSVKRVLSNLILYG